MRRLTPFPPRSACDMFITWCGSGLHRGRTAARAWRRHAAGGMV